MTVQGNDIDFIGAGWNYPLGTDATGGVALVTRDREIEQAIRLILGTAVGERESGHFAERVHELAVLLRLDLGAVYDRDARGSFRGFGLGFRGCDHDGCQRFFRCVFRCGGGFRAMPEAGARPCDAGDAEGAQALLSLCHVLILRC